MIRSFLPCAKHLASLLPKILSSSELHAKWLNTLSFLENCGARKIAACEHPTKVKEEMLKHAAEEFRHAHYLKRQIERISIPFLPDYSPVHLLGGTTTLHYLPELDVKTSRYISSLGWSKRMVKEAAYLLVTYAIELRAEELYPIYETALQQHGSKVKVRSILLEEQEHLEEMQRGLRSLPQGNILVEQVCSFEGQLCQKWLKKIQQEIL